MNYIEQIRTEIKTYFDPAKLVKGSAETAFSPDGRHGLHTACFTQTRPGHNWTVTRVEIFDNESKEIIFSFYCNDDRFFYSWLNHGDIAYFICAEDIFGGQTIIDLARKTMASYSPGEDGFIWTNFYLSPDAKKLATLGCYWACPTVIKIFDFTEPMILPLREIKEIRLLENNEMITGWLDAETIQLSLAESKTVREDFEDGSHSYRRLTILTGEKRDININNT